MLDEYANLSPKVHIEYVDPEKNPQLARAAGIREFGTAVVQIGDKKETAKSMTEEGITGAFIRDLKGTTRTVCFVTGSGEHAIDDTERDGLSQFKDLLAKDEYSPRRSICCKRQKCRPTAPRWWSPAPRTTISSRRWMQSRSMSRMAAARSSCWIRRFSLVVRRLPPTMR